MPWYAIQTAAGVERAIADRLLALVDQSAAPPVTVRALAADQLLGAAKGGDTDAFLAGVRGEVSRGLAALAEAVYVPRVPDPERADRLIPLVEGYCFAVLPDDDAVRLAGRVPAVVRVVSQVTTDEMARLRVAEAYAIAPAAAIQHGETVQIAGGPLRGQVGVFMGGRGRWGLLVQIPMLGSRVVEVDGRTARIIRQAAYHNRRVTR